MDPLSVFSEATRDWFERTFDGPTPPQARGVAGDREAAPTS